MKLREVREKNMRYDAGRCFVGRKKKYAVTVSYTRSDYKGRQNYWHYLISREDINYTYNSLWNDLYYKTQEECVEAVEKK